MAYVNIAGSDNVKDSRQNILDRDEELRHCFAGTAFPVAGATMEAPIVGQLCYRTDQGLLYQLVSTEPDTWEVVNLSYFLALAGGTLTGLLKLAKGESKAAAATLNLSNRTGNFIHVTGATGITGITIDAGDWALLWFDSNPVITLSANLIGPPTLDTGTLAMAANDMALVVGDGSGVARIVNVFRISGNAVNDARYQLADGSRAFAAAPLVTGAGRMMRPASGNAADSGRVSWGTAAPGALAEGEIYLRHA